MDRLSLFIAMMTWSLVSGCLIILFMTLGYIGWTAFAVAVVLGFALGLPLAKMIAARIKRQDPSWDEKRNRRRRG
jgi:NAD/NADP transhydrogenase alpha subunit